MSNTLSDKIYVSGSEADVARVLDEASAFAGRMGYSARDERQLRLLSEELAGLMSGITSSDFQALFWAEGTKEKYELHLLGKTEMTSQRREELLATARDGKNAAAAGIMGKIRDMIAVTVLNWNDAMKIQAEYGDFGNMSFMGAGMDTGVSTVGAMIWNLSSYRESLQDYYGDLSAEGDVFEDAKKEPWDELERSIIGNLADDVRVSIRSDQVEIVIYKAVGA